MRIKLYDWCIQNGREQLITEWDYEKNDGKTLHDYSHGSEQRVWWRCELGHSWDAVIGSRASGSNCPYCSGRFPIPGETDLATTNPEIAAEWHPTKNKDIALTQVKSGSHVKVWWLCSVCGNEWEAVVSSRGKQKCGCPECGRRKMAYTQSIPQEGETLQDRFPEIALEWDYELNYPATPETVYARSSQKSVGWICAKGHKWKATPANRTGGRGCPVCSNKKILKGYNDLETLRPQLAKEWHPTKNTLKADEVTANSNRHVWWLCSTCGKEWEASPNSRRKSGCPRCVPNLKTSFQEKAIAYYLKKYGFEIIENYRPKWMKKKELDIYIPSLKLAIEYDGEKWHTDAGKDLEKTLFVWKMVLD